ncbi:uncharacterized protein LOC120630667 [Pararge aegeria]|uniref:Jg23962 protein n=1 Tax=Pararge aegeria aegeria TaxID=348720 RepID=A0A8S4RFQ3_9NEOP|nr:uncharacterized protein LOC120630667 [Pararge aegeria]CAH2235528.1 jg23962 [Pararge aegeria aegeria]
MKSKIVIATLCVFLCEYSVSALSFPGPRVYVVTPSTRILKKDEGKPTPFYYHNWMRRMDTGPDTTTSTTTEPAKVKTPDLIFAEFESDGSQQKSIRKLLENERTYPKKSTMSPIYVPDDEENKVTRVVNYGLPVKTINQNDSSTENNSYILMSHDEYNNNFPDPEYVTASQPTLPTTAKITTTTQSPINIQNIWHVIDSEKADKYLNKWEEISFDPKTGENTNIAATDHGSGNEKNHRPVTDEVFKQEYDDDDVKIDDNFALPGFVTNPGNGAENESRAIRTEQNIRFPYVNLKPFQMKPSKKPLLNNISNGKKSNLFTSLDNFYDLKSPVRGEAQDIVPTAPIDRYNPAQPYLPQQKYGSNLSKQSSPGKATASLVPPPPPQPSPTGIDFPDPISYESFPPYAPSGPDFGPAPAPAPPVSVSIAPSNTVDFDASVPNPSDDGPIMDTIYRYKPSSAIGDSDNTAPMMNTGYNYKPPSAPTPQFYPTPVPPSKPFQGYSYNKPSMTSDTSPMTVADKPEFQGYHYSKPVYHKPPVADMPPHYGSHPTYGHDGFPPVTYEHDDSPPHIYGHDDAPPHIDEDDYSPPHSHHSDDDMTYSSKPYGDVKGGDDMNGHDMGMKPPAPPSLNTDVKPGAYGPSPDDHGFPSDFPTDFKFPPDFNDHYHDHEHEHYHIVEHPTTTTETPRVNRFSYYYLGKKLYYLPLYFSVYFIIYVGALIIKAVLRHKIVYPNSWRPNTTTSTFFSKRSVDQYLSHENLHDLTKKVTHAISTAAEKYMDNKNYE